MVCSLPQTLPLVRRPTSCQQVYVSRAPSEPHGTQVGVSYGNRQETIKKTAAGEPLLVVREPTNPVDANAVAVLTIRGEQLGYVKKVTPAPTHPQLTFFAARRKAAPFLPPSVGRTARSRVAWVGSGDMKDCIIVRVWCASHRRAQELTQHFLEDVTVGRVKAIGHADASLPLSLRMQCVPSHPSLTVDMLPPAFPCTNLSEHMEARAWNHLQRASFSIARYRCQICREVGARWPVECHERYEPPHPHPTPLLHPRGLVCPPPSHQQGSMSMSIRRCL